MSYAKCHDTFNVTIKQIAYKYIHLLSVDVMKTVENDEFSKVLKWHVSATHDTLWRTMLVLIHISLLHFDTFFGGVKVIVDHNAECTEIIEYSFWYTEISALHCI